MGKRIFSVTKQESKYPIDIVIYDSADREIKTLWHNHKCIQGDYRLIWDGLDNKGQPAPAGKYFAEIKIKEDIRTKQIQIIR